MKTIHKPIMKELRDHVTVLFGNTGILKCGAKLAFPMAAGSYVIPYDKPDRSMVPVVHVANFIMQQYEPGWNRASVA